METSFHFATPWPWWLIVAAAGGAGALTWRGYLRRQAEVKGRVIDWLMAARYVVWGILFLCLLQPMHRSYVREERASRLTVLVDESESMGLSDVAREGPRLERVRGLLKSEDDGGGGLLASLDRTFKTRLEGFAGGARPLETPDKLSADGPRTDLNQSLSDAFSRLKGPDAGGLILFSDGADTTKADPAVLARVAQRFRRAGVPIYAVGVGAESVPDLAVTQVRCRRTVQKDTLVKVEVDVERTQIPPGTFKVRIMRHGEVVKETDVDLTKTKATAIFEFLPTDQGFLEYEARIEPYVGELITENNSLAFGLMAFNRKLKVLFMEGSVYTHGSYGYAPWSDRWEHEFMVYALEEDKDVEVTVLLKGGEDYDKYTGPLKTVREGYPKSKKDLYEYDVIVSSDIPYDRFSKDQVNWTVDFVGKHGGGFLMIGGWDAFGEGRYAKSEYDRMLPVEMEPGDTHHDGIDIRWRVTDEGYQHPIMQIDKDEEKNKEIWELLNKIGRDGSPDNPRPSFHGFSATTRAKPGAERLAVIDDEMYEGAYGPMLLVAVQSYGAGRSMAFTTDSTGGWGWEWQHAWGPTWPDIANADPDERNRYYKIFWKNAIRWLAEERMKKPNQLVLLETDRLVYGRGEVPEVRVKVLTRDYEPTSEAKVTLALTGPEGKTKNLTLFPRYEEPGIYERKLNVSQVGRYELEAVAELDGEELGRDKALLQVRPSTEELRRLSLDAETLKRLAESSGGEYVPWEKAAELPDLLRAATHEVQHFQDKDLWDHPLIFLLIIGLLCAEWFYRKRAGLP